jgi:VanZ family protein
MMRGWWVFGVVLVAVALVVCLIPMPNMPTTYRFGDKVAHMLGHAALALYFTGLVERRRWWRIFAFLLVFGIVVEILQATMNIGRDGDARDVLGNVGGCLLGLLLGYLGFARWPIWLAWVFGRRAPQ